MPFEKGHKLATGRPRGSQNKELAAAKKILNKIIFEPQSIIDDFNNLDVKGRMEFRCRMAKFVIPEQKAGFGFNTPSESGLGLDIGEIQNIINAKEEELPSHQNRS